MLRRLLGTAKGTSVPELTPREANERVVAGEAVLVDVREESEWETGRIPGSVHVVAGAGGTVAAFGELPGGEASPDL